MFFFILRVFMTRGVFSSPKLRSIPWCVIFSTLSTPVHLYYRPQIKSIRLQKDDSEQIGFIVKMKMQD